MQKQKILTTAVIGFALYLISTGLSFAGFSMTKSGARQLPPSAVSTDPNSPASHFEVDLSIPRTEPCPINGRLYTKQEKDVWSTRRPLAVMIENHEESRPQSGLSHADVIYEAVAEGGITRFMGIFYCGVSYVPINLSPVRSARTYFLPWVLEYDALYNHVGGAGVCSDVTVDERAKALCQIDQYKIKDMDQFGLPLKYTDKSGKRIFVCYRNPDRLDHPVATEHTMVCNTDGLYAFAEKERSWTNVDAKGVSWDKNFESWKFKDEAAEKDRGASFSASFAAWKGYEKGYGVRWDYDPVTNSYKRTNGGSAHTDLETKEQLTAKNIVVMFAKETGPVDTHAHLLYANVGSGDGLLWQDGKEVKIKWSKPVRTSRTKFTDATGKEINFNRGQIWIEMLPTGTTINK